MEIKFQTKFTSLNFKWFVDNYWNIASANIIINLSNVEWISHEGIVLLFSFINQKKMMDKNIVFKIMLPDYINIKETKSEIYNSNLAQESEKGAINNDKDSIEKIKTRRLKLAISLMEKWKILDSCNLDIEKNIIADTSLNYYIQKYRDDIKFNYINFKQILEFYKINCDQYKDLYSVRANLPNKLNEIFSLNKGVEDLLSEYYSNTPFKNKSLANIVTYELILNVAHHAYGSNSNEKNCYFSIALYNKISETKYYEYIKDRYDYFPDNKNFEKFVARKYKQNVESERIPEEFNFFKQGKPDYQNKSYLELCLVDFGQGIVNTLLESYIKNTQIEVKDINENNILKYAFELDSSRNEIGDNMNIQPFVPRGLYFLIDLVRRYKGMILVRSYKSRILFDFSKTQDIKIAVVDIKSEEEDYNFPGTYYNIILPETQKVNLASIHNSEIRTKKSYINKKPIILHWLLLDWATTIEQDFYRKNNEGIKIHEFTKILFNRIDSALSDLLNDENQYIIYLDFVAFNSHNFESKIFHYLCNTPKVDANINIIVVNFEDIEKLKSIQEYISRIKPFIFRPIPCIFFQPNSVNNLNSATKYEYTAIWIGIKYIEDEKKLNELLRYGSNEGFGISPTDIKGSESLDGNLIYIDWVDRLNKAGNIKINYFIPKLNQITFKNCIFGLNDKVLNSILKQVDSDRILTNELLLEDTDEIYFTSGGYFQEKFIRFIRILHIEDYSRKIATYLINKLIFEKRELPEVDIIISVTLSSGLLSKSVREIYRRYSKNYSLDNEKPELLRLSHYHEFEKEENLDLIKEGSRILLINDVISTGKLVNRLYRTIKEKKGDILYILSIVDCRERDITYRDDNQNIAKCYFDPEVDGITVSLVEYPIRKYKNNPRPNASIIRINPVINAPSDEKLNQTGIDNILNHGSKDILDYLNAFGEKFLKIGYLQTNHHYHYYFVDTSKLFASIKGKKLLDNLIKQILEKEGKLSKEITAVFYPMFSGAENIEEYYLKDILHADIKIFPLPRISTDRGWRLTLPSLILEREVENQDVLIIDDGSNSGETLIQMIDVVSFLNVRSIIVLSIVSRLEVFHREFFSRVSSINVVGNNNDLKFKPNNIKIYFGFHFHIPHYNSISCQFIKEKSYLEEIVIRNQKKNILSSSVEKYIETRLNEIAPKNVVLSQNTIHYLPTSKDPNIDLFPKFFFVRDLLGKVEGFRLFNSYFKEFHDAFYDKHGSINYELIEILAAVINHEHYLINSIVHLFPDIYMHLGKWIKKTLLEKEPTLLNWNYFGLVLFYSIIRNNTFFKQKSVLNILTHLSSSQDFDYYTFNFVAFKLWQNYFENPANGKYSQSEDTFNYLQRKRNQYNEVINRLVKDLSKLRIQDNKILSSISDAYRELTNYFSTESSLQNHSVVYLAYLGIEAMLRYPFYQENPSEFDNINDSRKRQQDQIFFAKEKFEEFEQRIIDFFGQIDEKIVSNLKYIVTEFENSKTVLDPYVVQHLSKFKKFNYDFHEVKLFYDNFIYKNKREIFSSTALHPSQVIFKNKLNLFFSDYLLDDKLPREFKYNASLNKIINKVFQSDTSSYIIISEESRTLIASESIDVIMHPGYLQYCFEEIRENMKSFAEQKKIKLLISFDVTEGVKMIYFDIKQEILKKNSEIKSTLPTELQGGLLNVKAIISLFNGTFEHSSLYEYNSIYFKFSFLRL